MQKQGDTAASEQNQQQNSTNSGATSGQRNGGGVGLNRSGANNKKDTTICRWQKDYGITREVLEQHFGKSRDSAAETLNVSESTLKRACRDLGITRWPTHKGKGKRPNCSLNQKQVAVKKHKGTQALALPPAELEATTSTIIVQSNSTMSAKVIYKNHTIRFLLPSASTMLWLEEKLGREFQISIQNFYIEYKDEEDEWITLMCDSELMHGMDVLRSSGHTIIRMKVNPKSQNLPSPGVCPNKLKLIRHQTPAGSLSNCVVGPSGSGKGGASEPLPPNGFGTTATAEEEEKGDSPRNMYLQSDFLKLFLFGPTGSGKGASEPPPPNGFGTTVNTAAAAEEEGCLRFSQVSFDCDSDESIVSSDSDESIVSLSVQAPHILLPQDLPIVKDKPLPEKGKFLQAVMKAGPLLQTLLLASPLPQWRHPPPPMDSYHIPPAHRG